MDPKVAVNLTIAILTTVHGHSFTSIMAMTDFKCKGEKCLVPYNPLLGGFTVVSLQDK